METQLRRIYRRDHGNVFRKEMQSELEERCKPIRYGQVLLQQRKTDLKDNADEYAFCRASILMKR